MFDKIIKKIGLTSFQLKIIAIITMTIDHVGLTLMGGTEYYSICRIIGRIAFPIYCFLIAEGFVRTSNVKKYALRLFVFALVSEIPFNLMLTGRLLAFGYQNVFFTLLLGLLLLCWYSYFNAKDNIAVALLGVPAFMVIAHFLNTDYSWWGVMIIFLFYAFKDNKLMSAVSAGSSMLLYGGTEKYAVLSLIPILLYNGKKGRSMKYFFYMYYPLHILVLCVLRYVL